MSSIKEQLNQAIRVFNAKQSLSQKEEDAREFASDFEENARRVSLIRVFTEANNPELNQFLVKDGVKEQLDLLGVHRGSKRSIHGLKIREFSVPRSNQKFGYNVTLAYISSPGNPNILDDLSSEFSLDDKAMKDIVPPTANQGLVFVKEVGVRGSRSGKSLVTSKLVELIPPKRFASEGLFEAVLTPDLQPEDVKSWIDQRFIEFITTLHEQSG